MTLELRDYEQYDKYYPQINAEVIADSFYPVRDGTRLTTILVTIPLIVLGEITRHRIMSFSVASNRAISTKKLLKGADFTPVFRKKNLYGMQPKEFIRPSDFESDELEYLWDRARENAIGYTQQLQEHNVAKELSNRLLHPFQYVKVLISSTNYTNFFNLRNHKDAQFELQVAARKMKDAIDNSIPKYLQKGEWHLPFIRSNEKNNPIHEVLKVSVARCARTSYSIPGNEIDSSYESDLRLFNKLLSSPLHASPFEMVATPATMFDIYNQEFPNTVTSKLFGNYQNWLQLRSFFEPDKKTDIPESYLKYVGDLIINR